MRTLVVSCLVSLSAFSWGCSSNAPGGNDNAMAGSAPAAGSGSGGGGSGAPVSSSGSTSGGAGGSAGTGLGPVGGFGPAGGSGGSASGGAAGSASAGSSVGGSAGSMPGGDGTLGNGDYTGSGTSSERYHTAADIKRNGQNYVLITNGWGPGFQSHTISWNGTAFTVDAMAGTAGDGGQPASYPTVFCGQYSVMQRGDCGLPKAISEITSLRTGWRWAPNGNDDGAYNAAYDIWVGDGTRFTGYLMVWLRDPPGFQPAGQPNTMHQGVTVENVPGTWDIWDGSVNSRPIVNWVRREGTDIREIEFDVLDFVRDAEKRGLSIPGATHIRAVAVGFEIWQGPVMGLQSLDFYANVK